MNGARRVLVAGIVAVAFAGCVPLPPPGPPGGAAAFGEAPRLDLVVSYPAGLFHWVDSLAGTSLGKTVPGYQRQFISLFGRQREDERQALERFARLRRRDPAAPEQRPAAGPLLLAVFCAVPTPERGYEEAERLLGPADAAVVRETLELFRPRYDVAWREGRVGAAFLESVRRDARRLELGQLLGAIASFFGADPATLPRRRIVVVPVPTGWGTSAQAVGRQVLLEVRSGDTLTDQAAVIVHETVHSFWQALDPALLERLAATARTAHPDGERAWRVLHEALPTALGQGVADRLVAQDLWSMRDPWYHEPEVDRFAKRLYPAVAEAVERGRRFDEAFVLRATELFARTERHGEGGGGAPRGRR